MTDSFDPADHPRQGAGKFTDKTQGAPEAALASRKPGALGGYEIRNFKRYPIGREGGAFSATIYRDGKRVLTVENGGNGGQNDYTDLTVNRRNHGPELDALQAMAKKALGDGGYQQEDSFVDLAKWFSDIEKHIAKHGFDRSQAIEENIEAYEATAYTPLNEREKELLRNPDILSADWPSPHV